MEGTAFARFLPIFLVLALAVGLVGHTWTEAPRWTEDSVYYEAQLLELKGYGRQEGLERAVSSPYARGLMARSHPRAVTSSAPHYRRRWTVPLGAAALDPLFGSRSLELMSLLGYVAAGLLLYALLRRRFPRWASVVATSTCLLLPPFREWSYHPLTDSWGVALEAAALLAAVLVLDRGARWLPLWTAAVIALAFTRDSLVVLVVATGWLWLRGRTRTRFALFSTSLVGTVVPGLIFGAPFREQLAYILNDYHPDPHATWSSIAHEYGGALARTLDHDLRYPFDRLALPLAIVIVVLAVAAVALLIFRSPRGDHFFGLIRWALVGGLLTLALAPNYTGLRLELVFLPPLAAGLALLAQEAHALITHRGDRFGPPVPAAK